MAEWLKAHAWKACKRETVSRVRIPLSPPFFNSLAQLIIYNKMVWASYGRQQMKKLILIIIATLFFQQSSFALSQQEAIEKYLSGRALDTIEGIWIANRGRVSVFYKSGNQYYCKVIRSADLASGQEYCSLTKGSDTIYYGRLYESGYDVNLDAGVSPNRVTFRYNWQNIQDSFTNERIWPSNLNSHNAKFLKKSPDNSKGKKTSGASGTAFFITSNGHLITNHHVIDGCNNKSKIIYKDKEYSAKLIAKDKLLDFALLKTDITKNKFLVLSENPPKKLQRIIAAGYPLGKSLSDDLKFTSGIISSLKGADDDSTLIQIDAALNRGNSGGPIVDEKTGELVAVAVAGMRKDKTEAINFGIKTNSLKNFLDSNQIKTSGSKLLFSFGSVDVSQILEESTVYTYCK